MMKSRAMTALAVILVLAVIVVLSGCETVNLGNTIAGGKCGTVDYRITVLGTPLLGIQAERDGDCETAAEPISAAEPEITP